MAYNWRQEHPDVPSLMKKSGRKAKICALYAVQGGLCYFCGAPMTLALNLATTATVEHLLPRSLGGSSKRDNLAATHAHCNNRRSSLTIDEMVNYGIVGPTGKTITRATVGTALAYACMTIVAGDMSLWYGALDAANPAAEQIARIPGAPQPRMV